MLVALPAMTNAPPAVAFAARLVVHTDDEADGLSRFVVHVSLRVPHGMTVARARRGRGDTLRLSWDDGTLRLAARPPTRGLLGEPASVRRTARLDARRFPGARVVMLRGDRALIVRRSGLVAEALYASETPLRQGALSTIQVASSRDAGSMDGALRLAARTLRIYYGDADPRRFHPNPMARALIRRSRLAQRSVPRLEVSIILPELSADEVLDVEHAADVIKLGGDTIEIQRDGVRYERDPDTSCYIRGTTRPIRFLDPFENLSSYALRLSTRASAAGEVVRADYLNVIGVRERDAVQLGAGLLPTLAVRRLAGLVDVERFSYPASVEIPPAPTRICPPPKSPAPGELARHVRAAAASGDPARLVLAASR